MLSSLQVKGRQKCQQTCQQSYFFLPKLNYTKQGKWHGSSFRQLMLIRPDPDCVRDFVRTDLLPQFNRGESGSSLRFTLERVNASSDECYSTESHECFSNKEIRRRKLPVLGMVAGLLWGQGTGQSGHLDPDCVVQVLLTGVHSAGNNERHAEQTGSVLLRRQEVQLCAHLKRGAQTFTCYVYNNHKNDTALVFSTSSHHLPVHSDDVSNEGALVRRCDVSIGDPVGQRRLRAAGPTVRDEV